MLLQSIVFVRMVVNSFCNHVKKGALVHFYVIVSKSTGSVKDFVVGGGNEVYYPSDADRKEKQYMTMGKAGKFACLVENKIFGRRCVNDEKGKAEETD
jgi:hypothetical protein